MAALPTTGIDTTLVRSTLGESNNKVTLLCKSSLVNQWSRYKPANYNGNDPYVGDFYPIGPPIQCRLGDFRMYEHNANPPLYLKTKTYEFSTPVNRVVPDTNITVWRYDSQYGLPLMSNQDGFSPEIISSGHLALKAKIINSFDDVIGETDGMMYIGEIPNVNFPNNNLFLNLSDIQGYEGMNELVVEIYQLVDDSQFSAPTIGSYMNDGVIGFNSPTDFSYVGNIQGGDYFANISITEQDFFVYVDFQNNQLTGLLITTAYIFDGSSSANLRFEGTAIDCDISSSSTQVFNNVATSDSLGVGWEISNPGSDSKIKVDVYDNDSNFYYSSVTHSINVL